MHPHRHLVLIAVLVLLTSWASALEGTKLAVGVDTPEIGDSPYGYLGYLPPGYHPSDGNTWPVWIFLEGLGEGGPGTVASMLSPAYGIVRHGPMRELWRPADLSFDGPAPYDYPMIVLTPQVGRPPAYRGITDIYKLDLFITAMLARYRIDPDRVVLSGMSTGGGDAVYYASYRVENVQRLAGLLPMVASHNYPADGSGPGRASTLALTQSWFMTAFDDRGNGGTVTTAYAWSDAIAQALAAAVTPTPASLESTYPFGSGGMASANHQTATFGADNAWTWRAGATADRRSSGAFKPDDTSRLMLGIYSNGGHPIWQDAVNNPDVLNWIISRQRQAPFTGTPHLLPGSIQAEQYDRGGPGRGFNELTSGNQGTSAYRQRTLPRWSRSGSDGQLQIANAPVDDPVEVSQSGATISIEVSAGEWVAYTSDVALSGSHDLVLRVASRAGAALRLTADGTNITGPVTIPATGGPSTFQSITIPGVNLTEGRRILQVIVDAGTASIDHLAFNRELPRQQTVIDNGASSDQPNVFPISITTDRFTATGWNDFGARFLSDIYGPNCLTANAGSLGASATYRPHLLYSADYAVELWYPHIGANLASARVPVTVTSSLGATTVPVDQRINTGSWFRLGVYPFARGLAGSVTIAGAPDNYARADAVRFSPVPSFSAPATASTSTVTGTSVALSAAATFLGSGAGLTYTWSVLEAPARGEVSFSANGTATAATTTATFTRTGAYRFAVAVRFSDDPAWPTRSSEVSVTVQSVPTSIAIMPASITIGAGGSQTFSARELDQFGMPLVSQPGFTWSRSGPGNITADGVYTANAAGNATVTASHGGRSTSASISISADAPAITALNATPLPVTANSTSLTWAVSDPAGMSALTYGWSHSGPAVPTLSSGGPGQATATFTVAGTYYLTLIATNPSGGSSSQTIAVEVLQTHTSTTVAPSATTVQPGTHVAFQAIARDQFNAALTTQPRFTWSTSGGGTIDGSGLMTTAGTPGGPYTMTALANGIPGTGSLVLANGPPSLVVQPVALLIANGTGVNLSALGVDDGGEAGLTYTWRTVAPTPSAVTFPGNGGNGTKAMNAVLHAPGSYTFAVTIADAFGLSVESAGVIIAVPQVPTITVSPYTSVVVAGSSVAFTTSVADQFDNVYTPSPGPTWTVVGPGSIDATTGLYGAGAATTGDATIRATLDGVTGTSAVHFDVPPLVNRAAQIVPSPVSDTVPTVSVIASDPDDAEATLTYRWFTVAPSPEAVFTPNGTNAAKSASVSFSAAGPYTLRVEITDPHGLVATSEVAVDVLPISSGIRVTPAAIALPPGGTATFVVENRDQFGGLIGPFLGPVTWTITGGGSITSAGAFAATSASGSALITATSGSYSATADVSIGNLLPTIVTQPTAAGPVSSTTVAAMALGADDGGEAELMYNWMASGPAHVIFTPDRSNAAKSTIARFSAPGTYQLIVVITDRYAASATGTPVTVTVLTPGGPGPEPQPRRDDAGGSGDGDGGGGGGGCGTGTGLGLLSLGLFAALMMQLQRRGADGRAGPCRSFHQRKQVDVADLVVTAPRRCAAR